MASNTMKYYALVAWANVCKWGWWTWRKVVNHWSAMPDRCRVYACIMFVIVLLSVSIKAFADHAQPPGLDNDEGHFMLQSAAGAIVCQPNADSEGLHTCWPVQFTSTGPVFGEHGWCFEVRNPFTEEDQYQCSSGRNEALDMKAELDEATI